MPCFSGDVFIKTQRGNLLINQVEVGDKVPTARNTWRAITKIRYFQYSGPMYDLPAGGLVKPQHHILVNGKGVRADKHLTFGRNFEGYVYNLVIETDPTDKGLAADTEHSYTLDDGTVVHN